MYTYHEAYDAFYYILYTHYIHPTHYLFSLYISIYPHTQALQSSQSKKVYESESKTNKAYIRQQQLEQELSEERKKTEALQVKCNELIEQSQTDRKARLVC